MKKVTYTYEQMVQLSVYLNGITVTGINNCKLIAACTQIIDNPVDTIEEENKEEGEKDEP